MGRVKRGRIGATHVRWMVHPSEIDWRLPVPRRTCHADTPSENSPREALLAFLESVYTAGARLAGWDMESFRVT